MTECKGDILVTGTNTKIILFDPHVVQKSRCPDETVVLIICSTCDMCQTWAASIEGWPVLSWLFHVSSSSYKSVKCCDLYQCASIKNNGGGV